MDILQNDLEDLLDDQIDFNLKLKKSKYSYQHHEYNFVVFDQYLQIVDYNHYLVPEKRELIISLSNRFDTSSYLLSSDRDI